MSIAGYTTIPLLSALLALPAAAEDVAPDHMQVAVHAAMADSRQLVQLPPMMQPTCLARCATICNRST
jgi:hypothetical protein